jgi:uncharacterized protein (DUF58 family)
MAAFEKTSSIVDSRLLAVTQGLALTARRLVSGALTGQHASRRPGFAREFSQYRAYQPGDEPRHIDWKLFARSDRYFLRESDVDARVAVSLVLDATESMQHTGETPDAPRKFDRARALAAALALLAENQGDDVSLFIVSDGASATSLTAGQRQPFRRIVHTIAQLEPAGRWPDDRMCLARSFRRAELEAASCGPAETPRVTIVMTDGHEHGGEIRAALAPLRARRHEVMFFHFVSPDERDFPYRGPVRFEEWETGRSIEVNATTVRAAYLAAEKRERAAWSRAWADDRFDYLTVMTDEDLARGLRSFLRRRMRR